MTTKGYVQIKSQTQKADSLGNLRYFRIFGVMLQARPAAGIVGIFPHENEKQQLVIGVDLGDAAFVLIVQLLRPFSYIP